MMVRYYGNLLEGTKSTSFAVFTLIEEDSWSGLPIVPLPYFTQLSVFFFFSDLRLFVPEGPTFSAK